MKIYILLITAILSLFGTAQELPIASLAELSTYAVQQSVEAQALIVAPIPTGQQSYDTKAITEPSVDGVLNAINSMTLTLLPTNPTDSFRLDVWVYNAEHDMLFKGVKPFKLKLVDDNYILPEVARKVELVLADEIPIFVSDLISAQVLPLNENGEIQPSQVYSLHMWPGPGGKFFYPQSLIGDRAVLSIGRSSTMIGTIWNYYSLETGKRMVPQNFNLPLVSTIRGLVPLTDTDISLEIPTVDHHGENVAVEYRSTTVRTLKVSARTSEGVFATHVLVRPSGTNIWQRYAVQIDPSDNNPKVILSGIPPGILYISFDFPQEGLIIDDPIYVPPVIDPRMGG